MTIETNDKDARWILTLQTAAGLLVVVETLWLSYAALVGCKAHLCSPAGQAYQVRGG